VGTSGQSNYVAANGYLNGLARQRRRRGLAASALDIGLVIGIGYAAAAGQHLIDSLQKYGITPLSEPDVRLAFAESIQAGYASPKDQEPETLPAAVMTSGLRTITTNEKDIIWHNNPIFSHLVVDVTSADDTEDQSRNHGTTLPIREQLARATSIENALQILRGKTRIVLLTQP
jgi:hybrid polyketide synthase/nonribosomal peptide synthetase ACE1